MSAIQIQENSRIEPKLAGENILSRLLYDQWHVFEKLRHEIRNVNVLNLACMLGSLPRMGYSQYSISQEEIAYQMSRRYNMPLPSRQSVGQWEKTLAKHGYLEIPNAPGRGSQRSKKRCFTEKFWTVARRGMDKKFPYTNLHEREINPPAYEVELKPNIKKIRTCESNNIEQRPDRASLPQKGKQKKWKQADHMKPPRYLGPRKQKKLSYFENSVRYWLFRNWTMEGTREAHILYARFLKIQDTDPFIQQLSKHWRDKNGPRDCERPNHVNQLVKHLRKCDLTNIPDQEPVETTKEPVNKCARILETPQRKAFRSAMLLGDKYDGPAMDILERFRRGSEQDQEQILKQFQLGKFQV